MKRVFLALMLSFATVAPAIADRPPVTPDDLRTFVDRDDFEKTTKVRIGDLTFNHDDQLHVGDYVRIVASKKDGQPIVFILIFQSRRTSETGWGFWKRITDANGTEFTLKEIKSDVNMGILCESFFAAIPRGYLDGIRKDGVKVRAYGQATFEEFELEPQVVDAFLTRVDAEFPVPKA